MPATLTHIGKYRIERELGRGAMGVVYKAFDPVVERSVAVKTIRLDVENAGELITRLRREAKSVGQLEHPNIVTLYDAGESGGLFFLAMQFIQGETLQDRITRQRWFILKEVLETFSQICAGLDYAHRRGVIHRDIKPANIMITHQGVVKLTDFGIAKIAGTGTTSTGLVVGTPSYMSPEQALGKPLDGRSDIFSLGSILYEMMTGEKAFPGQNATTVMYKIVHEAPTPLVALQPGLDPAVEGIVLKALAKAPEQRFSTCNEFAAALELYISRAIQSMPKTTVASAPPMTSDQTPSGPVAPSSAAVPAARSTPAARLPSAGAVRVASSTSIDEVSISPVTPSGHAAAYVPPPGTGAQPGPRQGVPLAWLGGGVLGTLLLVAVILLIVQMRQPSPAPAPVEQAPVETAPPATSPGAQPSPTASPTPVDATPPETKPTTQTPTLNANVARPPSPAPTRRASTRLAETQRAVNPLAAPPVQGGAKPVTQAAPPAGESRSELEPAAPSPLETYPSVMLKGDLAFQQNQYEKARAHYLKAYRMNPGSREVRRKLVMILTLLGKPEEALKYK